MLNRDSELITHERKDYSLFELMGALGGLIELVLLIFGVLLHPISENSFIVEAIEKLFWANTKDPNLFNKNKKK